MKHENEMRMSRLVRKTLGGIGILAIGFFAGYLGSNATFTSDVQGDPLRVRIAVSTPNGNQLRVRVREDPIAIETEVAVKGMVFVGMGFAWVDGPKTYFTVLGPPIPIPYSDFSS